MTVRHSSVGSRHNITHKKIIVQVVVKTEKNAQRSYIDQYSHRRDNIVSVLLPKSVFFHERIPFHAAIPPFLTVKCLDLFRCIFCLVRRQLIEQRKTQKSLALFRCILVFPMESAEFQTRRR